MAKANPSVLSKVRRLGPSIRPQLLISNLDLLEGFIRTAGERGQPPEITWPAVQTRSPVSQGQVPGKMMCEANTRDLPCQRRYPIPFDHQQIQLHQSP
jgi:hypothetical protein